MNRNFYHMKSEAFGSLPVPDLFFNSKTHKRGWHYLVSGITSREPFLVVTGDHGTGKTMLCMMLVRMLKEKGTLPFACIFNPDYSFTKVLCEIADSLGIVIHQGEKSSVEALIYRYFKNQKERKVFCLIIDDAHELDAAELEKLRSLANFNHNGFFPIRLIFFSHTAFLDKLKSPALIPLDQKIRKKYHLTHFDFPETREYIYFRLFKSGAPGIPALTEEALKKIFSFSRGIPRLTNNVCSACINLGSLQGLTVIGASLVMDAIKSVGGDCRTGDYQIASPYQVNKQPGIMGVFEEAEKEETAAQVRLNLPELITTDFQKHGTTNPSPQNQKTVGRLIERSFSFFWEKKFQIKGYRLDVSVASAFLIFLVTIVLGFFWQRYMLTRFSRPAPEYKLTEAALKPYIAGKDEKNILQEGKQAVYPRKNGAVFETEPGSSAAREVINVDSGGQRILHPYSLRLASFRFQENALYTLSHYRSIGLSPYLVKVDLGERGVWWRLYLGHYKTREEAQKVKKEQNLSDSLVKETAYANLIGVFSSKRNMEDSLRHLDSLGYFPYVVKETKGNFRLFIGAFNTRKEVLEQNLELRAHGIQSRVVKR